MGPWLVGRRSLVRLGLPVLWLGLSLWRLGVSLWRLGLSLWWLGLSVLGIPRGRRTGGCDPTHHHR